VVAVIVRAHSCDGEDGRGRQITEYMHRQNRGLTLRPFVVFDGRQGDPLIDETLNDASVTVLADYLRRRVVEGDVHAEWTPERPTVEAGSTSAHLASQALSGAGSETGNAGDSRPATPTCPRGATQQDRASGFRQTENATTSN
jgi:hypothetical protein